MQQSGSVGQCPAGKSEWGAPRPKPEMEQVARGGVGEEKAANLYHIMDQSNMMDHWPPEARPWEGWPCPQTPPGTLPAQWTSHGSSKVRATCALEQPSFLFPPPSPGREAGSALVG